MERAREKSAIQGINWPWPYYCLMASYHYFLNASESLSCTYRMRWKGGVAVFNIVRGRDWSFFGNTGQIPPPLIINTPPWNSILSENNLSDITLNQVNINCEDNSVPRSNNKTNTVYIQCIDYYDHAIVDVIPKEGFAGLAPAKPSLLFIWRQISSGLFQNDMAHLCFCMTCRICKFLPAWYLL